MFSSKKTTKVDKKEMDNKNCGGNIYAPRNDLKMYDVPDRLHKTLIQVVLKTITNNHK